MPRRLPGRAIQAGTITVTQLETTVATTVQTGGGPKITNVEVTSNSYVVLDDTAVDIAGGYIKITGTGFAAGCQVLINNTPATSTTFVSATEVRAQVPATAAGSYIVYLVNTDGGVAIRINGITFSTTPTWVTGSSLAGNVDEAISIQLSATGATSYALAQGSTLPTGLTLSSGGLLSGTITGLVNDTSYSFTINAIDAEFQDSPRSFTISISTNLQVTRSLRFNPSDTTYLARSPSVTGNRKTWTWSGWFKRSTISDTSNILFCVSISGQSVFRCEFDGSNQKFYISNFISDNPNYLRMVPSQVFRDTGAWYHFVIAVDTTQAVDSNRVKFYVNGQQVTQFDIIYYPSQNFDTWVNATYLTSIGCEGNGGWGLFNGYMANLHFIDGQQLTPSSFAKTDTNGQWIPSRYTGTYGTNGYYLNFADNSNTTATTLGKDSSGNNNNFTPNNFSVTAGSGNDSLVESPTMYGTDTGLGGEVRGNYCTWNPLNTYSTLTLTDGALRIAVTEAAYRSTFGTMAFPITGKWYLEIPLTGSRYVFWGIATPTALTSAVPGSAANGYTVNLGGTQHDKYNNGTVTGNAYTTGALSNPILKLAYDADSGKLWLGYNTTWFGTSDLLGDPTAGTNPTFTVDTTRQYVVTAGGYNDSQSFYLNAGQRTFAYAAPSGFKSLNTHNLPALAVTKSNTAFDAKAYTGNGTSLTVSEFGFAPDLVWIKGRSTAYSHYLFDTIRGATKMLYSESTSQEDTGATSLTAFTSNGFTVGTNIGVNNNATSHIAWAWDAGTTTVVNTAGTIQSNVRVNAAAGISIVSYTGTQATATVGHGLGTAPKVIIAKSRSVTTTHWVMYHSYLGSTNSVLQFSSSSGTISITNYWGSAVPTSTVFGVANGVYDNNNGSMIAYCFAEVPGFSSFGGWTGNGSADGPFIYTGFRPAMIIAKQTNTAGQNWYILDSNRSPSNVLNRRLYPNLSNSEDTDGNINCDLLSNGFKLRDAYTGWNASGGTYIYAAFAESPFKYARAR